jgi:hypothetical protein
MPAVRPLHKIAIDWITFRLTLPSTSNFWSVRAALEPVMNRSPYVKPMGVGPGGSASDFEVKLQDPAFVRSLGAVLQKLWPGSKAALTGMEIAFDTYIEGADRDQLARHLFEQFKWMEYATDGDWYLYRRPREGREYLNARSAAGRLRRSQLRRPGEDMTESELVQLLAEQWQLTDRKIKSVPARFHLHVKTTDVDATPLPRKLWRARMEVTLKSAQLPWSDVDQLLAADFARLQVWFRLRQQAVGLAPAHAAALRSRLLPASAQPGRRGRYKRPVRGRSPRRHGLLRSFRSISVANSAVNAIVYDRLRRLKGPRDP